MWGNRYRYLLGWIHALAMCWCFYPFAVCMFWPDEPWMGNFCITGVLLLLPIIVSWYTARKLEAFGLYILTGIALSLGYGILNGFVCAFLKLNVSRGALFSLFLSLFLFLVRGRGRIGERTVFLDAPSSWQWAWFGFHYVWGSFYQLSFYWHMAYYLFLLDIFLSLLFFFFKGFGDFLQEHSHSAGVPLETMKKVNGIILCISCLSLFAFALPSLLYGNAPLTTLSFEEKENPNQESAKKQSQGQEEDALSGEVSDYEREILPGGEEESRQTSRWLAFLSKGFIYVFCVCGVLAVLVLIYRFCKRAGKSFTDQTGDKISFLEKEVPGQGKGQDMAEKLLERMTRSGEGTVSMRVRRYYKKLLRRRMQELPAGIETPRELEAMAGFTGSESELEIHLSYEKARYSQEGCGEDEVHMLKKYEQDKKQRMTGPARHSYIKTGVTVPLVEAVTQRKKTSLEAGAQTCYWSNSTEKPCGKKEDLRMEKSGKFRKMSENEKVFESFLLLIMTALCAIIFYPLYYVAVASVTDPRIVNTGKALLYPEALYLDGYRTIFAYPLFWVPYKNTLIYTAAGTLVSLGATIPAGYALSRKELAGRKALNGLFIFTMFFSGGMMPLYLTILKLGIYNSIWAMILPAAVSVYNLLVCRSYFEAGIWEEVWDAARVDGCSYFGFFFKFVLPLSKTITGVMALFYATAQWNQYWNAILFLRDEEKMPLQVQLTWMSGSELKYCTVMVAALPFLLIYPFFQKYFVQGVSIRGVKS